MTAKVYKKLPPSKFHEQRRKERQQELTQDDSPPWLVDARDRLNQRFEGEWQAYGSKLLPNAPAGHIAQAVFEVLQELFEFQLGQMLHSSGVGNLLEEGGITATEANKGFEQMTNMLIGEVKRLEHLIEKVSWIHERVATLEAFMERPPAYKTVKQIVYNEQGRPSHVVELTSVEIGNEPEPDVQPEVEPEPEPDSDWEDLP